MTQPTQCTLTMEMRLEVTDPDALLTWAAHEATRSTVGQPALQQEMTRALVQDVAGALRWAYTTDPDCEPPGIVLLDGVVTVV